MEEDADAAAALQAKAETAERPQEAEWPDWSGHVRAAWSELRDDRFRGAMGGIGRIYFTAIDRYAARFGIAGEDFDFFHWAFRVLDDEYVRHIQELEEEQRRKHDTSRQ